MSVTITVNDLSLCHQGSNGIAAATVPDVCKTPSPGGPVPMPYPNIARSSSLTSGTKTVQSDGGNSAAIKGSEFSQSNGDEAGTLGGVKSSTNMKEATWISYSFDVRLEGQNACRLTDKMQMNHGNTVCLGGEIQSPLAPGVASETTPDPCDHVWVIKDPGQSPEEGKKANQALSDKLAKSPSKSELQRGYDFENKAIDENMQKLDIQAIGRIYECDNCHIEQEVDIVGKNRVAESKSRNFNGVKKKGKQSHRVRDIQQKLFDKGQNPLAKIDGNLADHAQSTDKYLGRGFNVEVV